AESKELGMCPSNTKIANFRGRKTIPESPIVNPRAFYEVDFSPVTLLGQAPRVREKRKLVSKKILAIALATAILASFHLAEAQQPLKVPRIGFLSAVSPSSISPRIEAFRQGLRELGYVEEKNIVIEWRWAEGKLDRL